MREIKISQETASRWYNGTDSELKALAIQTYPELEVKELPKNWEELGRIKGYYMHSTDCSPQESNQRRAVKENRNIFATIEQASASIAMAQLSQLMAVYNDGWVADYKDNSTKYQLVFSMDRIVLDWSRYFSNFLTFKDGKTAGLFLENFKDLIQTAKPLL